MVSDPSSNLLKNK